MLYFLAIILPPVAVLMVGKPIQALLNLVLTLLGWLPGVVHAFLVINSHKADRRNEKVIKAMKRNSKP
jgi:uncharacterized membrane protein YqaE (UPF0057 family)